MSKYQFCTVVATPEIRASFTQMRNELGSSDKELMSAIWKVVTDNAQPFIDALEAIRSEKALEKAAIAVLKKGPKKAAKKPAKKAKAKAEKPEPKAKKLKGNRAVTDEISTIESADDEPPITICDGRQ